LAIVWGSALSQEIEQVGDTFIATVTAGAVIDRVALRRGCGRGGGARLRAARMLDHEIADRSGRHRHGKRRRLNLPLRRGSGRRRDQKRGDERGEPCRDP